MKQNALTMRTVRTCLLITIILAPAVSFSQDNTIPNFDARVTLNLKNANVTDVFRLLAMQNDLNIVVSPSVRGTISLRLSNVTLRDALDVILDSSNSRMEQTDNIIHIYAMGEKEAAREREDMMVTEIITINYVDPKSLLTVLKDYMSPDGKARIFDRKSSSGTSSEKQLLIVNDYPENMEMIREMHQRLDTETRQVMINSKIVETSLNEEEILGTDWDIKASLSGAPFKLDSKYADGGSISYGTLSLKGFQAVYQRLMDNRDSNVLSDAKLATLDGEKAHIHVGDVIPVGVNTVGISGQGSTSFGTTGIQQWEVGVTIDVTPVVLEEDIIRMEIQPEISSVQGYNSVGGNTANRAPVTSTRLVDTKILIKSGETIVIGGLVQDIENHQRKKVPVLGDLPLVGSMFRKKETNSRKINLIIFITGALLDLKGEQARPGETTEPVEAPGSGSLDEYLEYK